MDSQPSDRIDAKTVRQAKGRYRVDENRISARIKKEETDKKGVKNKKKKNQENGSACPRRDLVQASFFGASVGFAGGCCGPDKSGLGAESLPCLREEKLMDRIFFI